MDLWTKRTLPIPHRIADDINNLLAKDSVIFSKTQYHALKSEYLNIWGWSLFSLTMMSYLASGVFVNSFIMSRFGTYGPFFSFLKSQKCEFYEQKDFDLERESFLERFFTWDWKASQRFSLNSQSVVGECRQCLKREGVDNILFSTISKSMGRQHFLFGRWQHFVKTMGQSYGVVLKRHMKWLEYVCLKFMEPLIFLMIHSVLWICKDFANILLKHVRWSNVRQELQKTPAGSYLYAPLRVLVKFWLSLKEIDVRSHWTKWKLVRLYLNCPQNCFFFWKYPSFQSW